MLRCKLLRTFSPLALVLFLVWAAFLIYPIYYSCSRIAIQGAQHAYIKHHKDLSAYEMLDLGLATFREAYDPADGELQLNGCFYDVATFEEKGGQVVCYVLKDKDETELHKGFNKQLGQRERDKSMKTVCWLPLVLMHSTYPQKTYSYITAPINFAGWLDSGLHEGHLSKTLRPPAPSC